MMTTITLIITHDVRYLLYCLLNRSIITMNTNHSNNNNSNYHCYLISCQNRWTYVGITNDLNRRLRQHNGQLKGGAKYTTSKPSEWTIDLYITGFPDKRCALQFEWKWKHLDRKQTKKKGLPSSSSSSLNRRHHSLGQLMQLERVTANASLLSLWPLRIIKNEEPLIYNIDSQTPKRPIDNITTHLSVATTNTNDTIERNPTIDNKAKPP